MTVSSISAGMMTGRLSAMRQEFDRLQLQLATGRRAETYGDLGAGRSTSVTFNQRLSSLGSYADTIAQVGVRTRLMNASLERLGALPSEAKSAIDPNIYQPRSDGQTDGQRAATLALEEAIGLLNTDVDGRHLFSGAATSERPVVDLRTMLHGEGDRAGFDQIVAERAKADLGAPDGAGRQHGRLAISQTGATVTLAKPVATVFGFSVAGTGGSLSNVTVTPSGSPANSLAFAFAGQPATGEMIRVTLGNPDGTTTRIDLTVGTGGNGTFAVGADATETATNFAAALDAAVAERAATELRAASAFAAGADFFDTENGRPPQRVVPVAGDLYAATSLADADPATTVVWYAGQNDVGGSPRGDVTARVDGSTSVAYGARANERGLSDVLKALAVASSAAFDPAVATDKGRYAALAERVQQRLSFEPGAARPQDVQAAIAVAAKSVESAGLRNRATQAAYEDILGSVESVSEEEVATLLLQLKTQLEASYKTISMLSELSLVNYV